MTVVTAPTLLMMVMAPAAAPDYSKDIKPLLGKHCFACHSALRQKSDLRLDAISLLRSGGVRGPALAPGRPEASLLMDVLLGRNDAPQMPPKGNGRLTAAEIQKIREWIQAGAKAPPEAIPTDPRKHWAYRPPQKMQLPPAPGEGVNPIDFYFARVHRQRGLTPQPPLRRDLLLRRVALDLIGLPPSAKEIEAFVNDSSPDAYAQAVRRLLNSPHHGERWGRHFMDIWRYTDWFGLGKEVRYSQKHIWRWRDWIVESINDDKGYDRMLQEMLAADEIAGDDPKALRATGYLARNWYLFNRNFWLDDVVQHTAKGFLGVTLNCARCHDHKYDPIAQREYYQWRAFFEPHQVRLDPVSVAKPVDDGLPRAFDRDLKAPTWLFVRGLEEQPDKSHALPPRPLAVLPDFPAKIEPIALPPLAYYPALRAELIEAQSRQRQEAEQRARKTLRDRERRITEVEARLAASEDSTKPFRVRPLLHDLFQQPNAQLWRETGGSFQYRKGGVLHTNLNGPQQRLEARDTLPRDFVATLRLTVRGGSTRSVGMAFDRHGKDAIGVYLSPGSRFVSMYVIRNGRETYPARKNLPVVNDKTYVLTFAIRGQLLNAWLNGQFAFAHRLQHPRRPGGGFAVTNYQSIAEYHELTVTRLDKETPLAGSTSEGAGRAPPTAVVTRAGLLRSRAALQQERTLDQLAVAVAAAETKSYRLRAAAERIAHGVDRGNKTQAAQSAAAAEYAHRLAKAELALVRARQQLAAAKTQSAKSKDQPAKAAKAPAAKKQQAKATKNTAATDAAKAVQEAEKRFQATKANVQKLLAQRDEKATKYTPIGTVYPRVSSGRRSALARWMTRRDNPLTARVLVNHVWTRHFGSSLVASMFDFGLRTPPPLHQDLLDHLAVELMEHGWSMKFLHRRICESQLYQMDSTPRTRGRENRQRDRDNTAYWRMNTRRMEHEVLRDSLLQIAGRLDPALGGPDLPTADAETARGRRRSLYYRHARDDKIRMARQFDDASVEECYRRKQTIVPQQALVLANSEFVAVQVESAAKEIAEALAKDAPAKDTPRAFISHAFRVVLGRSPRTTELAVAERGLQELVAALEKSGRPHAGAVMLARRHLTHVLVMHNDFITIR